MTLHLAMLEELLDEELTVARERLLERVDGIRRDGHVILSPVVAPDGTRVWLRLDGSAFDAEPLSVTVVEDDGSDAPSQRWPTGLQPVLHPVHGRMFVCVEGCAEYYSHPSHFQERWDVVRARLRLAQLLDHLLRRAGRP